MSISASPYLLVLPQLMSAKKKLGRVAAFYDPAKISLSGFESVCLDATQFREQLRRNMNIILTDEELGALVYLFDKNGDGFIDSVEFKNEFFRLGKQDREKFNFNKNLEKKRHETQQKKLALKQKKYLERFSRTNVAEEWTDAQQRNAIKKIANIAYTYDSFKGGLEGFAHAKFVEPAVFKELMRRKFETYLTPEETGALVDMFDRDDNGMVDSKEFVYQFFRIGRREREYHFNKNKKHTLHIQDAEIKRKKDIHDRFGSMTLATMVPSTEADRDSALNKITHAAIHFKSDSAFSGNLWKSFESSDLNPTEFKELLKTNFDIILSPGELDAMVKLFDTDNSGDVSCVEFMTTFFRIGLRERSRILAKKRVAEAKLAKAEKIRKEALTQQAKMACLTSVVWPILPDDDEDEPIELGEEPNMHIHDLASILNVGPEEITRYLLDKHAMLVKVDSSVDMSIAKDVIVGHGRKFITWDDKNSKSSPKAPVRSVAPMIPTGSTGRHNAFLQKRPTLQSAIAPNSSKSGGKGKKKGKSLADQFPKASKDTKEFIRLLEIQEKEVHSSTKIKRKGNRSMTTSESIMLQPSTRGGRGTAQGQEGQFGPESTLNDWKFSDDGQAKASMYQGTDEFESRPGTSANSQRSGTSPGSRDQNGGSRNNTRMLQPLDGTSDVGSIAEEY